MTYTVKDLMQVWHLIWFSYHEDMIVAGSEFKRHERKYIKHGKALGIIKE